MNAASPKPANPATRAQADDLILIERSVSVSTIMLGHASFSGCGGCSESLRIFSSYKSSERRPPEASEHADVFVIAKWPNALSYILQATVRKMKEWEE